MAAPCEHCGHDPKRAEECAEEAADKLRLAGELGAALLDDNRELQERNEFLEESAVSMRHMVLELQHKLEQKEKLTKSLLDADADYDSGESDSTTSPSGPLVDWVSQQHRRSHRQRHGRRHRADVSHIVADSASVAITSRRFVAAEAALTAKLRALEQENNALHEEAQLLRAKAQRLEEKEQRLVTDSAAQICTAHEKIENLSEELLEKSDENQATQSEITHLRRQLKGRFTTERQLAVENEELTLQLYEAQEKQERLKARVLELTEWYSNTLAMLYETQDELKQCRRAALVRPHSPDSLYESLASELEHSDGGKGTSRSGGQTDGGIGMSSSVRSGGESAELSDLVLMTSRSQEHWSTRARVCADSENARVALTVTTTTTTTTSTTVSAPITDTNLNSPALTCAPNLRDTPPRDVTMDVQGLSALNFLGRTRSTADEDVRQPPRHSTPISDRLETGTYENSSTRTSPQPVETSVGDMSASRITPLSKASSTDSLSNYEGPPIGQPGVPGTRDLEFAIRRMTVRRCIEMDYQKFRRDRGYGPSRHTSPSQLAGISETPHVPSAVSPIFTGIRGSRLRILKPLEGSHTLRQWRTLAAPNPFGALAQRLGFGQSLPVQDIAVEAAMPTETQLSPTEGICMRQNAVEAISRAASECSNNASVTSNNIGRAELHQRNNMIASPRALRRLATRSAADVAGIGLEAAVDEVHDDALVNAQFAKRSGVLTRAAVAGVIATSSPAHQRAPSID